MLLYVYDVEGCSTLLKACGRKLNVSLETLCKNSREGCCWSMTVFMLWLNKILKMIKLQVA